MRTSRDCLVYSFQEWRCACLTVIVIICVLGTCLCEFLHHLARHQARLDADQATEVTAKENEEQTKSAGEFPVERTQTTLAHYEHVLKKAFCCQTTYLVICGALVFLFYLVYLIECWNSAIWMRSVYCVDTQSAYRFIDVLRRTIPVIYWHVSCYHYSSSHSPRTVTNAYTADPDRQPTGPAPQTSHPTTQPPNSSSTSLQNKPPTNLTPQVNLVTVASAHQTYSTREQKVITASGTRIFDLNQLNGMWDLSGDVSELELYPLVEINLRTECLFANETAKLEFERERCAFYTSFEKYDMYMETDQVIQLSPHGTIPNQVFVSRSAPQVPIYLRQGTFLLAALFLLSFPLRVFIHSRTARLDYTVRKIFGPLNSVNGQLEADGLGQSVAIRCDLDQPTTPNPLESIKFISRMRLEKNNVIYTTVSNNNEAVVLCNRNISVDSVGCTSIPVKSTKRWQRVHGEVPSGAHDVDEDDDDELLSLDIRFDELHCANPVGGENIVPNKYVSQDSPDPVNSVQ
ncbi:unnamed protein product [Echinostoma caproni]|uniref:Transmembrane protein 231 n=1 Tax=Echinostoma caproni TaxID=27848 RepID=A0A183A6S9_9TREM|nr:unnamed protein product [Echinostoma caproni]